MEELFGMLLIYLGCCLTLLFVVIIMYFVHELDDKIGMWLTERSLKNKFGAKWDQYL